MHRFISYVPADPSVWNYIVLTPALPSTYDKQITVRRPFGQLVSMYMTRVCLYNDENEPLFNLYILFFVCYWIWNSNPIFRIRLLDTNIGMIN